MSAEDEMVGDVRIIAWEDGIERGPDCGLEDCECPEHDYPARPAGTYITIRFDGAPRVGLWRVRVTREPDAHSVEPAQTNRSEHA